MKDATSRCLDRLAEANGIDVPHLSFSVGSHSSWILPVEKVSSGA